MSALAVWAIVKRIGGWLSHASVWQLVSIGLAVFALVQHFELAHARSAASSYLKQRDDLSEKLQQISDKKNEQQVVTRDRIVTVTKTIHDSDGKAKIIENAPLPGNCKTPKEVLDADI